MHGQPETSPVTRIVVWGFGHLVLLALAGWIYLGHGVTPGDPARRLVLFLFGAVLWVRLLLTAFVFLKRRIDWSESGGVILAMALYQVGFALLGAGDRQPLSASDAGAIALFVLGGWLNTGAEWQRWRFKADPAHRGKLFTQGLFRLARHINYFGDTLWVTGWALLTRNGWSLLIPVLLVGLFVFSQIPMLARYLQERYGSQYTEWARTTRRFIPFVY